MTSGVLKGGGSSWWPFARGTANTTLSGWQKEILQLLGQQQFAIFLQNFQTLEEVIPFSNKKANGTGRAKEIIIIINDIIGAFFLKNIFDK